MWQYTISLWKHRLEPFQDVFQQNAVVSLHFLRCVFCMTLSFNDNQFELLNTCINETLDLQCSRDMSSGDGPQTVTLPSNECKCPDPDGGKCTKCTLKVKPKSTAQFTFQKGADKQIKVYIVVTAIHCDGKGVKLSTLLFVTLMNSQRIQKSWTLVKIAGSHPMPNYSSKLVINQLQVMCPQQILKVLSQVKIHGSLPLIPKLSVNNCTELW